MLHNPGSYADSSVPGATVVGAVTGYSVGKNGVACSGTLNGAGSWETGSDSDVSTLGGHGSWGSGSATGAEICAVLVWEVLAPAECSDFFK
jgi:hypothetical protein